MFELKGGVLLILGLGVFSGLIGAWLFQRIKVPQVVGYIVIGLIIGQTGFGLVSASDIAHLEVFNQFALGIIGFMVGGELKIETFRKYFRQFVMILLGEGLLAFLLVGTASTLILYLVIGDAVADSVRWIQALAGGVVFGAIASATDPASTIDVLWEYRSKGVMTTAIIAVVALDDALAMTLYGIGSASAQLLIGGDASITHELLKVVIELGGAIVFGAVFGFILNLFLKAVHNQAAKVSAFSLGAILLLIGASLYFGLDVIIATMTLGFVLINVAPRRSEQIFELMRTFSLPIYVVFFVLVGARISLGSMPLWMWGLVASYVILRSLGKMYGARFGAKVSKSEIVVQKYLGMGLFAQGGVAIGLSIIASHNLDNVMIGEHSLGNIIITVVTATTLCVQFIGPAMVKLAAKLSGEMGNNITRDDVIDSVSLDDVINKNPLTVSVGEPLRNIVELFSKSMCNVLPVVDADNHCKGIIEFSQLRDVLGQESTWNWLVAADIMNACSYSATDTDSLRKVYNDIQDMRLNELLVTDEENHLAGVLNMSMIDSKVREELLKRGIVGN